MYMEHIRTHRISILWSTLPTIAVAALALAWAGTASAATVYLRAGTASISAGDTAILEVRLGTEGGSYNVVEGTVKLEAAPGTFELRDLSVAGSDLSLWPRKPSWDERSRTISFTGGMPGGVAEDDALLFRIALAVAQPGRVTVAPAKVTAYANDGTGAAAAVSVQPLTLQVGEPSGAPRDALRDVVASDNEPPRFVAVNVGSDPSVYDGLLFLSIEVEDSQSGIDHLEVAEGTNPPVRTGGEYVLQDQTRTRPVTITAYDRAGNVSTYTLPAKLAGMDSRFLTTAAAAAVAIAVAALLVALVALRRRRKQP